MHYGDLIRDAFFIALRNRFLWIFGFFIGGSSSYVAPSSVRSPPADPESFPQELPGWMLDLVQWVQNNPASSIAIFIAVVLALVLLGIAINTLCRGALAESVAALDRGETRRFSSAWRAGLSYFWGVLGQAIVLLLIWLALILAFSLLGVLVIVGANVITDSDVVGVLVVVFGLLVLIPIYLAISISLTIIGQFALRDLVVGGAGVIDSIGGGFRIFRENLGRSLLLLLIQVGIALGILIVLGIVTTLVGLLLSIPVELLSPSGINATAIIVGLVLSLILSVPFIVLTGAIGTFHHAYWTLAYLRLTDRSRRRVV